MTKIFNLKTLHEQVDIATRHALDHAGRIASYKAREKAIYQKFDSMTAVLEGPSRAAAERIYQPERDKEIRALRAETDEARLKGPREIQAIVDAAREAKTLLTNPIQLATISNLGSERRTNYERTVSGLGPRALATLATQARLTGDLDLASALILENDKLPTQDRIFSSRDLAMELFGQSSELAQQAYTELSFAHDKSVALWRDSDGRKQTPNEQLASGRKYPGTRMIPQESEEVEPDELSPNQLLAAGLAKR